MGTGLGKNSPVALTLGKENYEALIERHGQWMRWRTASKCPCVQGATQQPDMNCKKCGGLGLTYGYQKSRILTSTVMVEDSSGIVEIGDEYAHCPLVKAYDSAGAQYPDAEKRGGFLALNSAVPPEKGVYVTAVMTGAVLQRLERAECAKAGGGYYMVQGLEVGKTDIEGLFHTAPCDIEGIERIVDAEGVEYEAKELRQNAFLVEPHTETFDTGEVDGNGEPVLGEREREIAEPLYAFGVDYIPPFTFVLLSQTLSKTEERVVQENGGDAVLTFPYNCDVAQDDVVTVLSGTYTQKAVVTRKKGAEYDVIGAYFVDAVVSCIGRGRAFESGVDFVLAGTNRIKWICPDAPQAGEAYSITYRVFPTYRVVKSIPQIRTSENQRMPKKAVVKLYDTYGEQRGINRQRGIL